MRRRFQLTIFAVVTALAIGTVAEAQRRGRGFGYYLRTPTPQSFDGSFNFCRVMFQSDRREKQGWATDYPGADINFSVRLAELTKVIPMRRVGHGPLAAAHDDIRLDAAAAQLGH